MDLDARLAALGRCSLFANIPKDRASVLAAATRVERFQARETVCAFGEAATAAFVVVSGELDVLLPHRDDPVRAMGAGDVFGEYAMLVGHGRTATVVARTDSVLLSIDYERFRAFLLEFPESTLVLLEVTARRLLERE